MLRDHFVFFCNLTEGYHRPLPNDWAPWQHRVLRSKFRQDKICACMMVVHSVCNSPPASRLLLLASLHRIILSMFFVYWGTFSLSRTYLYLLLCKWAFMCFMQKCSGLIFQNVSIRSPVSMVQLYVYSMLFNFYDWLVVFDILDVILTR